MLSVIFFLVLLFLVNIEGFVFSQHMFIKSVLSRGKTKYSSSNNNAQDNVSADPDGTEFVKRQVVEKHKKVFDMNLRVKLGRSKDQEGKSNIWSIEPTIREQEPIITDGENIEGSNASLLQNNFVIGGILIGAALACLPLFLAFDQMLKTR